MEPGALELVILVGEILERHGVSYALGGSLASSFFGMPRSTVDVDLAVDVPLAAHDALLEDLGTVFYVPEDSARAALEGAGCDAGRTASTSRAWCSCSSCTRSRSHVVGETASSTSPRLEPSLSTG